MVYEQQRDELLIHCHNVTLGRGDDAFFNRASFDLKPGDRLAVVGKSGCGKSSLFAAILGQKDVSVKEGQLVVGGGPCGSKDASRWLAENAGVMFQRDALFDGESVAYNLAFQLCFSRSSFISGKDIKLSESLLLKILAMVSLKQTSQESKNECIKGKIPKKCWRGLWRSIQCSHQLLLNLLRGCHVQTKKEILSKNVEEFSGGQKKRIALARVLALRPRLLLLDEPTSGLDSSTTENIAESIKNYANETGAAILCVTHNEDFAKSLECNLYMRINKDKCSCVLDVINQNGVDDFSGSTQSPVSKVHLRLTHFRLYAAEFLGRFIGILCLGGLICSIVSLLAGSGLVAQSSGGPRWIRVFVPQGLVAGVFLGLGTIIPALLVIGLCASAIIGELAQRKNSDQLAYLPLIGVFPRYFLGFPIVAGLTVALPLLTWLSEYLMLQGGRLAWFLLERASGFDRTVSKFWNILQDVVTFDMWYRSGIKGLTHGLIIGIIVCWCGFTSNYGDSGLRRAVSSGVILSSVLVIVADLAWSLLFLN